MLTKENILNFEKIYRENIDKRRLWEEKIFQKQCYEEWIDTVKKRSQAKREIFTKIDEMFDSFLKYLQGPIDEEMRECIYTMAINLFYDNYDDALLLYKISDTLLPIYEKIQDSTKILNLLNIKSFILSEYIFRHTINNLEYGYNIVHNKIYAYRKYYKQMDVDSRRIIMTNYYNMLCSMPTCLFHELNHTLDIYDEFIEFTSDKDIKKLNNEVEALQYRYDHIITGIWDLASHIEYLDPPHLIHFYNLLKKEYINLPKEENTDDFPYNIVMAYFYTSAYLKSLYPNNMELTIDWCVAFNEIVKYLNSALEKIENYQIKEIDECFLYDYYYPYQEMANYLFIIYDKMTEKPPISIMKELIIRGTTVLYNLPKRGFPWLMSVISAEWCESAVSILDDINDQENIISKIVIKSQIETHIHSQMVGMIADAILVDIINYRPELLSGLPCFSSIEEVKNKSDDLRQFVHKSALYHDIGKGKISSIINQQYRKISQKELEIIKQHPENGVKFFRNNSNFKQYFDIILGHHKFYDGKSGYPEEFDNVNSPYRIIIDLITICDCIDAATDNLGRNYTVGKDFSIVLEELILGKSTRYNPDIVDLIANSEKLQKDLTYIVTDGRIDIYYKTYKEYFT